MTRAPQLFFLAAHFLLAALSASQAESRGPAFSIWQGDVQRVGHLGNAQKDFNLIGERTWRDYQVRSSFELNSVSRKTTPLSGGNGVGFIFRFCGHVVGGPRRFPAAQPKWGYQPFGAIGWLRWDEGKPALPPMRQFYPGDNDQGLDSGRFPAKLGRVYSVLMACETLPDDAQGRGVTRYSFKIWDAEQPEPAD